MAQDTFCSNHEPEPVRVATQIEELRDENRAYRSRLRTAASASHLDVTNLGPTMSSLVWASQNDSSLSYSPISRSGHGGGVDFNATMSKAGALLRLVDPDKR